MSTEPSVEQFASDRVLDLISACADQYETEPEHWIHGWDEGLSFCYECAEKKVAELLKEEPKADYLVDGGWGSEGDSQAFCETCHTALANSFTTFAAEQDLDHFEAVGFNIKSPDDCYALTQVIYAIGCADEKLNHRIEALCKKILDEATQ